MVVQGAPPRYLGGYELSAAGRQPHIHAVAPAGDPGHNPPMFPGSSGSRGGWNRFASHRRAAGIVSCCAALAMVAAARGQSSRPGWGSTPYSRCDGNRSHVPRLGTECRRRLCARTIQQLVHDGDASWQGPHQRRLGRGLVGRCGRRVPGQQYKYYINYAGGSAWKHDPRARMVVNSSDNAGANDIIYDPAAFDWSGDSATLTAMADLVVYELHIGAFCDPNQGSGLPGRFTDATNRLDYLKRLGVSAVEVLPIAEFPGYDSWGYNPADPYAADNYAYGGPDGFKAFVKACHARGLAVVLDVVHNHYGPTDLDLWDFDGWTGGGNGGGIYFYQDPTSAARLTVRGRITRTASRRAITSSRTSRCGWMNAMWTDSVGTPPA